MLGGVRLGRMERFTGNGTESEHGSSKKAPDSRMRLLGEFRKE